MADDAAPGRRTADRPAALAGSAVVVAIVATLFFLRAAGQLLIPIVVGILVSYALEPVVAWLAAHRVPRLAAAALVLSLLLGLTGWSAYAIGDDVVQAAQSLPRLLERAQRMAASAGVPIPSPFPEGPSHEAAPGGSPGRQPSAGTVVAWAGRGVTSLAAIAGHLTVVVFLVLFLLISGDHFRARILEVAGPQLQRRRITARIIDDINNQIQRFLLVQLVTGAVVAVATWAVLAWMGVTQAALWGVIAGVFNTIPYFGPVVVSGGLFLVGLVQFGTFGGGVQLAGAALVITTLEGWLLTPALLGRAERLHVVVVFLGLLLWTWIWGAWGTVLAVPMLVVLKAVADHLDPLKPLSRLMEP